MRHRVLGVVLVLHGLAHAAVGVWAAERGARWLVTPLWWLAMTGLVAAGFGALGLAPFRRRWQPTAVVALLASLVLLTVDGRTVLLIGMAVGAAVYVALARIGGEPAASAESPAPRASAWRRIGTAAAIASLAYVSLAIVARPWHVRWGVSDAERTVPLFGDELAPGQGYRMDHAVTIDAPADSVWRWLVQIGQDRGAFYSYDWLERAVGDDIRNADAIHAEWQRLERGDLVRAVQPTYLGGIFGPDVGWRVAAIEPGRAFVLERWGAFVIRPVGEERSRLHVRIRGDGRPSMAGLLLGPIDLLVFEPAHFIMERGMLLGIKARAERMMDRARASRPITPME